MANIHKSRVVNNIKLRYRMNTILNGWTAKTRPSTSNRAWNRYALDSVGSTQQFASSRICHIWCVLCEGFQFDQNANYKPMLTACTAMPDCPSSSPSYLPTADRLARKTLLTLNNNEQQQCRQRSAVANVKTVLSICLVRATHNKSTFQSNGSVKNQLSWADIARPLCRWHLRHQKRRRGEEATVPIARAVFTES